MGQRSSKPDVAGVETERLPVRAFCFLGFVLLRIAQQALDNAEAPGQYLAEKPEPKPLPPLH